MFEILDSFDWITPTLAQFQDLIYGPRRILIIESGSGRSGHDINRMLQQHGVKTWGVMIVGGKLLITVKQSQAKMAQYLLQCEDVPLSNPMPTGERRGGIGGFIGALDRLLGG